MLPMSLPLAAMPVYDFGSFLLFMLCWKVGGTGGGQGEDRGDSNGHAVVVSACR